MALTSLIGLMLIGFMIPACSIDESQKNDDVSDLQNSLQTSASETSSTPSTDAADLAGVWRAEDSEGTPLYYQIPTSGNVTFCKGASSTDLQSWVQGSRIQDVIAWPNDTQSQIYELNGVLVEDLSGVITEYQTSTWPEFCETPNFVSAWSSESNGTQWYYQINLDGTVFFCKIESGTVSTAVQDTLEGRVINWSDNTQSEFQLNDGVLIEDYEGAVTLYQKSSSFPASCNSAL